MAQENERTVEERLLSAIAPETDEPVEEVVEQEVDEVVETDDDPPEPIEELEPVVEGDVVEMEIDGTVYEVPKALEKGFLQEKDYTQKSQTLADDRRQVELLQKQMAATNDQYAFAASIQDELTKIAQLDSYIQQSDQLNWHEMSTDEMVRAKHDLDSIQRQKDSLVETLTGKYKEHQDAQEQTRTELLSKGAEVLKAAIPGWDDAKQKEMRDYATANGYTEQELAGVTDPRMIKTLWKAKQFDELKAGAENAKVTLKSAPSIKAKGRKDTMSKEKGRSLNLRKRLNSGNLSSKDKTQAILDSGVIADKFA